METNNSNASISSTSLASSCSGERYWFAFLFSSLATFVIGVIAIVLWRCGALIYKRGPIMRHRVGRLVSNTDKQEMPYSFDPMNERNWATIIKEYAAKLISGQQTPGKILVCMIEVNRIIDLSDIHCR
jgi:potassium large conductance calcium-activated channel subfamily M alpha protein 1